MKSFIVLLLAYAAWASPPENFKEECYYWKEYNGEVPKDAIDAGDDSNPEPIYVGQGYFHDVGFLPGTLHGGSSALQVTEGGHLPTTHENVKILCSKHASIVRWMEVNYSDIACLERIGGFKIVNGGNEKDVPVFIGRCHHEGKMQVGKVYTKAPYEGLHLLNEAGGVTLYTNFEILSTSKYFL